jgi:hypothetical protein
MKKWKNEEILKLKELNNLKLRKEEIMVLFPGRSYDSIFKKSRKLGVKWKIILVLERAWTEYEKQI